MSASKVVVRRMRPGTKAHDLEQLLLRQWTSEHRAGRGHVHVGAFAVCMNMFADRTMLVRYVQGGGSAHNLVAGRVRLEATQSAPPKGHCNIYGWRLLTGSGRALLNHGRLAIDYDCEAAGMALPAIAHASARTSVGSLICTSTCHFAKVFASGQRLWQSHARHSVDLQVSSIWHAAIAVGSTCKARPSESVRSSAPPELCFFTDLSLHVSGLALLLLH